MYCPNLWFVFLVLASHVSLSVGISTAVLGHDGTHNNGTRVARSRQPGENVVISRDRFESQFRGKAGTVRDWRSFKGAAGPQQQDSGEVRFMSGLSIAFVIILNVLVWAVIIFTAATIGERAGATAESQQKAPRLAAWAVFGILSVYAATVYAYCRYAYQDPSQRVITNFLFGVVPLAISCASYVLALLVLDFIRSSGNDGCGFATSLVSRINPWEEAFDGRLIFFLAVLPGLAMSVYLGNTVSTGFKNGATHIDVLSLCLFVDVGRVAGHLSYLVAPVWSIGKSPDSISSRPGLCYVAYVVCVAWYIMLLRLDVGKTGIIVSDPTKIRTLASLTSYVFFPLSLYLIIRNLMEFFDSFETWRPAVMTTVLCGLVLLHAILMMLIGVVFDALEPNLMGIGALLFVVFFAAYRMSGGILFLFILAMIPLSAIMFGGVVLASSYAGPMRKGILSLV